MSDSILVDADVRARAIDPTQSFIVQAPAGSGKTGLLVLRYLCLLERAENPEEIIAITFTRKAAAEMRDRILQALGRAARGEQGSDPHDVELLSHARAVLERDREQGWSLTDCPARMRVQTIDSLCHRLVCMMPATAGHSGNAQLEDDAAALHREAAARAVERLEGDLEVAAGAVERALQHFDNQVGLLIDLLAQMLGQRQQWLRGLSDPSSAVFSRDEIEAAFRAYVESHLHSLRAHFPLHCETDLCEIIRFARGNLQDNPEHFLHGYAQPECLPAAQADALAQWQVLAQFLLTKDGAWRKPGGFNKGSGIPALGKPKDAGYAERKQAKDQIAELLEALSQSEHAELLSEQLAQVLVLPEGGFSDADWTTVEALFALLFVAAQELQQVFAETGRLDHSEVMTAALQALGEPDEPTDLALALDYQVRHLLIDEFQDTSLTQVELLRRLVAGWMPGDGRTLFLVGDPMQSIYAFREAEVGLFLRMQQEGIESMRPEPLLLQQNFRSCAQVVDWVNQAFPQIFPASEDASLGAISYRPAVPFATDTPDGGVHVHPFLGSSDAEAPRVVRIVEQTLREHPDASIAILVRGRRHLEEIVPALRTAGIGFQAVDVETLASRQCVLDVLSLTRALIHPGDRIAWLAVLRAPWCGLELADLHAIAGNDQGGLLVDRLQDAAEHGLLSTAGHARIERILPVLQAACAERMRKSLRAWVEGAWLALGGAACLESEADQADVEAFFRWLESWPPGTLPDPLEMEEKLEQLYALPDPAGDKRVQLMTLHKAKGLEFDTVILPGLGRGTGSGDDPMIRWRELPGEAGESKLLVAPKRATGAERQLHYQLLGRIHNEREKNESARLAYVGVTRAKRALHLLGCAKVKQKEGEAPTISQPGSGSLLGTLWPAVRGEFETALAAGIPESTPAVSGAEDPDAGLKRLPAGWCCPPPPADLASTGVAPSEARNHTEFSWARPLARQLGVVVHGLLEYPDVLDMNAALATQRITAMLQMTGVARSDWEILVTRAHEALQTMRQDERAAWLYSPANDAVQAEFPVSLATDAGVRNYVIDRTFVDAKNVRWIVDFKTGTHAGGQLDIFLDEEQARYSEQLATYARCLAQLDSREIRVALYFPLISAWREWTP